MNKKIDNPVMNTLQPSALTMETVQYLGEN